MARRRTIIAAIAAASFGLAGTAAGQGYPDRIVEFVVPSTPGASADILGRVLADSLSAQFGQRFVVLNKPGAGGVLGTVGGASQARRLHAVAWRRSVADRRAADRTADRLYRPIVR